MTTAHLGVTRFGLSPSLAAELAADGFDFARASGADLLTALVARGRAARPARVASPIGVESRVRARSSHARDSTQPRVVAFR